MIENRARNKAWDKGHGWLGGEIYRSEGERRRVKVVAANSGLDLPDFRGWYERDIKRNMNSMECCVIHFGSFRY